MEIQQHDGVVVEATMISTGLRQAQGEGGEGPLPVGERSRILKFSTHHQDQSMESSSNEEEGSASTYPCRSRAEAFKRTGLMESYSS